MITEYVACASMGESEHACLDSCTHRQLELDDRRLLAFRTLLPIENNFI